MAGDQTKRKKRRLGELAGLAYERDMARVLSSLAEKVAAWKQGSMSALDLASAIHDFDRNQVQRMFAFYTARDDAWKVAHAIHEGLLPEDVAIESPEVARALDILRERAAHEGEPARGSETVN